MAPEYAMEGLFSVKFDVYSFGIVLLEIISGKRCSGFYLTEQAKSLTSHAWHLWNAGRAMDFMDQLLADSCSEQEVFRIEMHPCWASVCSTRCRKIDLICHLFFSPWGLNQ